ncbi:hypothetical protein AVEN_258698-1 [Araneus ventricosus]|uniref:Uncharacterized protein n=1 Tax=Araneus ventricosus TaxID=182803 RepID=A0A4Y2P818_ARAVE|nr:hypothetical protein AVEN_258698-1 [Araneus ventricosus]
MLCNILIEAGIERCTDRADSWGTDEEFRSLFSDSTVYLEKITRIESPFRHRRHRETFDYWTRIRTKDRSDYLSNRQLAGQPED